MLSSSLHQSMCIPQHGREHRQGCGSQGKAAGPGESWEGWRDEGHRRTLILSHLLASHHGALLPEEISGDVSTTGYSYSFSKMPNWQLTTWYYLKVPKCPSPLACKHLTQISQKNSLELTNSPEDTTCKDFAKDTPIHIPSICLECSPLTFLLNFHISFKPFLGSTPLSQIPQQLSYMYFYQNYCPSVKLLHVKWGIVYEVLGMQQA